jgi:citrate lyase alpha subunit
VVQIILKAVQIIAQYNINFLADTDGVLHETATEVLYKIYTNIKNLSLKIDKSIKSGVLLIGILKKSWFTAT